MQLPDGSTARESLYKSSYALVIGIDKYQTWKPLKGAVNDARLVSDALQKHGFTVTFKKDLKATELYKELNDFITITSNAQDARVLIWFAGHGTTLKGADGVEEGYIVPADAPEALDASDEPIAEFQNKSITMSTFGVWMRQSRAKHIMAVFDSCFSGTALAIERGPEILAPAQITRETAGRARQMISWGDVDQLVGDDGLFRRLFIDAISGKAPGVGERGYVTGREIGAYLKREMSRLSLNRAIPQRPNEGYLNRVGLNRGDFVFEVVREDGSRGPRAASAQPPKVQPSSPGGPGETLSFRVDAQCIREWKDGVIASRDPERLMAFAKKCLGTYEAGLAEDRAMLFGKIVNSESGSTSPSTAPPVKTSLVTRFQEWWQRSTSSKGEAKPKKEPEKPQLPPIAPEEAADWRIANAVNTDKSYEKFIADWPSSRHLDEAKASLATQKKKKYTLQEVERAARLTSESFRGGDIVFSEFEVDVEAANAYENNKDLIKDCKWDRRTVATYRGFAIARLYYRTFLGHLRDRDGNSDLDTNPLGVALDLKPGALVDLVGRLRGQRFPLSKEAANFKLLASEMLERKKAFDKIDDAKFRKWEVTENSELELPDHPNACFS